MTLWAVETGTEKALQTGTRNEAFTGVCYSIDGTFVAGTGNKQFGTMENCGMKLRTNMDGNRIVFTVVEGYAIHELRMEALSNYDYKEGFTEGPCISVKKVEVDGTEITYSGGDFPAYTMESTDILSVSGINAKNTIAIYFDNSNAAGQQIGAYFELDWEKLESTVPLNTKVTPAETSIAVGESTSLTGEFIGGNFEGMWKSSNTAVAIVTNDGMVTGVSAGSADITYYWTSDETYCAKSTVTVNARPTLTTISPTTATIAAGVSTNLTGSFQGGTFDGEWISSNTKVATVSSSGVVRGVAPGFAYITYQFKNNQGEATSKAMARVTVVKGYRIDTLQVVKSYDFENWGETTLNVQAESAGKIWNAANDNNMDVYFCTNEGLEKLAIATPYNNGRGWIIYSNGLYEGSTAGRPAAISGIMKGQIVRFYHSGDFFTKSDASDGGIKKIEVESSYNYHSYLALEDGMMGFEITRGRYIYRIDILEEPKTFTAKTADGIDMRFTITDSVAKTCQVGGGNKSAINTSTSGSIAIPSTITYNGVEYSITSLANRAFYDCYRLTDVMIPMGVTSIGNESFYYCSALTNITLPESLTSLNNYAFRYCSALFSIAIPSSVTTIGNYAFLGCDNLEQITVEEGNSVYESPAGSNAIIEKSTNTLVVGCAKTVIPNTVTAIGANAFYYNGVREITIPESVTTIGERSFYGCKLTHVTIPAGVTNIGTYAFGSCDNLETVTSLIIDPSAISYPAFNRNQIIIVPKGTKDKYIAVDGWSSFNIYEDGDVIPFVVGSKIYANTSEGVRMLFTVTDVENKYCQVGDGSNAAIDRLTNGTVSIPASVDGYSVTAIGKWAFYDCDSIRNILVPDGINSIGYYAFASCDSLKNVTLPDGLKTIDTSAFEYCYGLTSIVIPATVTSIGNEAFYYSGITKLTSLIEEPFACGSYTFYTMNNFTLYVPAGTKAAYNSKTGWNRTKDIREIGVEPTYVDGEVFYAENEDGVTMMFKVISAVDKTCQLGDNNNAAIYSSTYETITIPSNVNGYAVTGIGSYAFRYGYVADITIPASITTISNYAFYYTNFNSLTSLIETPFNCSANAFSPGIYTTLYVPAGTKEVYKNSTGWNKFSVIREIGVENTFSDGDVFFADTEEGVKMVFKVLSAEEKTCQVGDGNSSSYSASANKITIPSNVNGFTVTCIGSYAFDYNSLTNLTIPNSVDSIGYNAFSGCNNLENIYFHANLDNLIWINSDNSYNFKQNSVSNITKISYKKWNGISNDSWTTSDAFAFENNIGHNLDAGNTVYGNPNVQFLTYANLTGRQNLVVEGTPGLQLRVLLNRLEVGDGGGDENGGAFTEIVSMIGDDGKAVVNIEDMEMVRLNAIKLGWDSPSGTVTRVYLQNSDEVTRIHVNNSDLWNMVFPDVNAIYVGDLMKYDASACVDGFYYYLDGENNQAELLQNPNGKYVGDIVIPNKVEYDDVTYDVTSISEGAFYNCSDLTAITIPASVSRIGSDAFYHCNGLTSIVVESGNTVYDSRGDCHALIETASDKLIIGCMNTVIPESVTSIGDYAFYDCSMASIHIPASVTYIGKNAFYRSNGMTSITVAVDNIVYDSRDNCQAIIETASNKLMIGCKNSVIPESVTTIANSAFYNCSGLKSVTIPVSVTCIGDYAFSGCYDIISVYAQSTTPAKIGYSSFPWSTLYVPRSAIDTYKSQWRNFNKYIPYGDAILTVDDSGQGTFCCDTDLDFSGVDGVKVYAAAQYVMSAGAVIMTRLTDVPAGTGVYVKGTPNTYVIPTTTTSLFCTNLLKGILEKTTVNAFDGEMSNYYLTDDTKVFTRLTETRTMNSGSAILQLPTYLIGSNGARQLRLLFDDEDVTAIEQLLNDTGDNESTIYDLQGRHVARPQRGLYIMNGKKIVVK